MRVRSAAVVAGLTAAAAILVAGCTSGSHPSATPPVTVTPAPVTYTVTYTPTGSVVVSTLPVPTLTMTVTARPPSSTPPTTPTTPVTPGLPPVTYVYTVVATVTTPLTTSASAYSLDEWSTVGNQALWAEEDAVKAAGRQAPCVNAIVSPAAALFLAFSKMLTVDGTDVMHDLVNKGKSAGLKHLSGEIAGLVALEEPVVAALRAPCPQWMSSPWHDYYGDLAIRYNQVIYPMESMIKSTDKYDVQTAAATAGEALSFVSIWQDGYASWVTTQ
jgi:hypothetical protein